MPGRTFNMRQTLTFLVRKVKRDKGWTLDQDMPSSAVIAMLSGILIKACRGSFHRIGMKQVCGKILVDRSVTLRNKSLISVGRNFTAEDYCEVKGLSRRGIVFGDRVTVGRFAMIRPSGYYGGRLGEGLIVGANSNIGTYCYIGCSGGITIGRDVMMGPRVSMHAENHNFADAALAMKEQGSRTVPLLLRTIAGLARIP